MIDWITSIVGVNDVQFNAFGTDLYVKSRNVAFDIHTNNRDELLLQTGRYDRFTKTEQLSHQNVRLVHIFEHQWNTRQTQFKNFINSILSNSIKVIYGRKCEIVDLTSRQFNQFIDTHHLQGSVNCSTRNGLVYNGNLITVIGFTKSRFKDNEIELTRYCVDPNYRVVGGLSKLLKHCPFDTVHSYVDYSHFDGHGYFATNFKLTDITRPNYVWIRQDEVYNRYQSQKHLLPKIIHEMYDSKLSEYKNMTRAGFVQSFDCGNLKVCWNRYE